jgi:hypothetical protein
MRLHTAARATIILAALCSPAAAETWQDRAQDAVTPTTDTQWMLVVIIERQQHIDIHGYASDDDCTKAGMTMIAKAETLPWFCVVEPSHDVVE